jgi:hypothetical protein
MRTVLALGLLLAAPAIAHADPKTFATVDEVGWVSKFNTIRITGTLSGDSTPSTVDLLFATAVQTGTLLALSGPEACQRVALIAMEHPGQYLLTVEQSALVGIGSVVNCSLRRNAQ